MKRTTSTALCAAAFLQMTGVGLIVTLLPGRVMSLSQSMVWVGAITSAFAVPFVLFQLPVGRLGDRYGFKPFIAAGFALACVVGPLYAMAGSVFGILAGRALQGLAEIPAWAVSMDSENVTPKGGKWDRENVIPVSFSFMRFLRHK